MDYLTITIALGLVVLFGYWSGNRRIKSQKSQKPKVPNEYSLSQSKTKTKLRRIK